MMANEETSLEAERSVGRVEAGPAQGVQPR